MITAIVLIDCATDSIPEVAEALADLPGVAEVIAGGISKTAGVLNTDTHIAFRAYSHHDLEAAFSIGFADAD